MGTISLLSFRVTCGIWCSLLVVFLLLIEMEAGSRFCSLHCSEVMNDLACMINSGAGEEEIPYARNCLNNQMIPRQLSYVCKAIVPRNIK